MNRTVELLRDLATTFASLADELDARDLEIDHRLNAIENDICKNKETLRAVATTILDNM